MKFKLDSGLTFKHVDAYMARFEMDNTTGLRSRKIIEIDPQDVFPTDFDLEAYDVTGSISISIEVKEKPKPK